MHPDAVIQGPLQLDVTHQKSKAETASPGDRLKRQPVLWMAMELRGRCFPDTLVHYLSIWNPGVPSTNYVVTWGFVYKPVQAQVREDGWNFDVERALETI